MRVWLVCLPLALMAQWPAEIFEQGEPTPQGELDRLVFAQWQRLGIRPARLCSDAVFVRRAYLDVLGKLPEPDEVERFLGDSSPDRRRRLIDRLLEREEFADYWAMKWSDLLRVKAEFPINLWPQAAQAYYRWIRASLRENKPYDQFARELLTASGSNFRDPPVNFYRAVQNREPRGIAQAVALTFMGARADKWPAEQWEGLAAFFCCVGFKPTREWKEEIVYFDRTKLRAGQTARLPDGTQVRLTGEQDPRALFAAWLVAPGNPWFARNISNRVWSWLLGRGIIHEPDDIRPDNPPSHPELLAYLERELVAARYNLKHLFRLILNSHTYQLSALPRDHRPQAAEHFAFYPLRRLEAEVLADALCAITGTSERYVSPIPEPFTVMPEGQTAVTLPDGSITSPFLELFGRPPRDTGLESERSNRVTAAQRLHLLNSSHIHQKLQNSPRLRMLVRNSKGLQQVVNNLYLLILSRYPTQQELQAIISHSRSGVPAREAIQDLAWVLINTSEFLYRH
jgi:hypothetical protein